jgi:hypothetical protein
MAKLAIGGVLLASDKPALTGGSAIVRAPHGDSDCTGNLEGTSSAAPYPARTARTGKAEHVCRS